MRVRRDAELHTFNPTLKAEEGGARLRKEGQEFKANQGYMRPCPPNTRILPDVTTRCQPRTLHKLVASATEF